MQRQGDGFIAADGVEDEQDGDATLLTVRAIADARIALHNKLCALKGTQIIQTIQQRQNLPTQSIGQC